MRPAAHIQTTIDLLDELAANPIPADRLMANYFRQRRYIGAKDKAAISELFYAVLRQRLSLSYLLDSVSLLVSNRLLVAMMVHLQGGDLAALFNGEKFSPRRLDDEQLAALCSLSEADLDSAPQNVRLNVPDWLSAELETSLGEHYESEMHKINQRSATDVRVNLLKTNRVELKKRFTSAGYDVRDTELSPWGLRFADRVALFAMKEFKQGWFEVQDEGSQLLAMLTQVQPAQRVVDFCAGAGGKTLAMAAMMQNKGVIHACDVHTRRLEQLSKRAKRAGVHNVRVHTLSSENDKWVKRNVQTADVVLIDAPCSGTGTWRRSPDSRWNLTPEGLQELITLQRSILRSAERLVKPGGRLIYATCSLLRSENEEQMNWFLDNCRYFEASEISEIEATNAQVLHGGHQLRTLPGLTGTDGFYLASFRRRP